MSKLLKIVREVLGDFKQYNIGSQSEVEPDVICSIQYCNEGGEYLRNFYIMHGELYSFISKTRYFDRNYYNVERISEYVWKYTRKC